MKYFVIGLVFTILAACVTPVTPLDLSPTPVAGASDAAWIREFDASLMENQARLVANYHGSTDQIKGVRPC